MRTFKYLISLFAFIALGTWSSSAQERASDRELLLAWREPLIQAIENSTISPCLASRNLAIIHIAAFNAVNEVAGAYEAYPADLVSIEAAEAIDPAAAAICSARFSSEILFPSYRAAFNKLWDKQYTLLSKRVSPEMWIRSQEFGESMAKRIINLRSDDGSASTITYIPKNEIGKWKRTPPHFRPPELPRWPQLRPFTMETPSQFRLGPPPSLDSDDYAQALNEVREIGSSESPNRTAEQTEIAQFWECFSYTSTPTGHWYKIAAQTATHENLTLLETARLMALITMAMADAGIAAWDTKYHYESWRPVHAIHLADKDGNPSTNPDTAWESLLEAPPHPEYVSGHATFSGAGGKIMELFFDAQDGYPFSTTNPDLPGVTRNFKSFSDCVDEICLSRLYGGIHFRYSNDGGRALGEQIGRLVFETQLQQKSE